LVGGVIAAWIGAGYLKHIPKTRMMGVIAVLLLATAALLAGETLLHGLAWSALVADSHWRLPAAVCAGLLVGAISSMLGVDAGAVRCAAAWAGGRARGGGCQGWVQKRTAQVILTHFRGRSWLAPQHPSRHGVELFQQCGVARVRRGDDGDVERAVGADRAGR